jgi:hypothetical protein
MRALAPEATLPSMHPNGLVVDQDLFSRLSGECEKVIDTQKRLPDFVFRRPFAKYFAIEYSHIYKKEFGAFLLALSNIFGDESVNYMTLDPSPEDIGYRQRSYFGLASFVPSSLMEKYVPTLFREQRESKILVGVNVGVFWGSSLKWGIVCDRISWEMAVIAVSENVDVPRISGFRCWNASEVSSYMKSQYHWKLATALEFNEKFLANYLL